MVLTLITILQAPAAKVSWLLWTVAGLCFLAGLGLLIYLIVSGKKTGEEELEEESGSGGLLSKNKVLDETDEKKSQAQEFSVPEKQETASTTHTTPLFSEADFSKNTDDKTTPVSPQIPIVIEDKVSSPSVVQETPKEELQPVQSISEQHKEPVVPVDGVMIPEIPEELVHQDSGTQVLTSQAAPTVVEYIDTPFLAPEEEIFSPQEEALFSQKEASLARESATTPEPTIALTSDSFARVDAPASPQRLEQSAKPRRELFEPPIIEPLAPRQPATQVLSSQTSPKQVILPPVEEQLPGPPVDSGTLPLSSAQTSFTSVPQTKPQAAPVWETQGAGSTRSIDRKSTGGILGLPAEASNAPLIIGQPSSTRKDMEVAAFSNYGKDLDAAETGRGGAITLFIAVLLIAGAALVYFFVPTVRSRTDALVAKIRGQQTAAAPVEKPKAQIYPTINPKVEKNIVKASGAITNISEENLEDLSVEISLDRGEGTTADVRTVAVKPNVLAPRQQGIYEFDYEGGKTTGFSRYRITKLLSKNGEVKFKTPNQ